jgi:hypothetical protein
MEDLAKRLAILKAVRANDVAALRRFHAARTAMNEAAHFAGASQTPLELAQREGRTEVVQLFVELGIAPPDATSAVTGAVKAKGEAKAKADDKARAAATRRASSPPKVAKALGAALERLGFVLSDAPLRSAEALGLSDKTRWMAHVSPPPGVFRAGDGVRGLRFCVPFAIPKEINPAERVIVIGATPGHWLTVDAVLDGPVRFARGPATRRAHLEHRKLETLLTSLAPDDGHPPARATDAPVQLSPALEAHVIASLADAGELSVAPGAVSPEALASLRTLRLSHVGDLTELDARFASLDTLVVRDARIDDLAPLSRLHQLTRLMLHRCVVADPTPLAQLMRLTELHLPHCLIEHAPLEGLLRALPSLRAVTLMGNRLGPSARALALGLPAGLDPEGTSAASLELTGRLASLDIEAAGVVRRQRAFVTFSDDGRIRTAALSCAAEAGDRELKGAVRSAKKPGSSSVVEEPESILAYPAQERRDPGASLHVPDEILEELLRLGVTALPSADMPANLWTATARHLSRVVWPQRSFATRAGADLTMADFVGTRLHVLQSGAQARLCIGSHGSGHFAVFISAADDPDPQVWVHDVEERESVSVVNHYPLSRFLQSLRV